MVRQDFDDPTLRNLSLPTLRDHALKFRFESCQARYTTFHSLELSPRDLIGGGAGLVGIVRQGQELPNCVQWEAELPAMTDERQPLDIGRTIASLVSRSPAWFRHETYLLVIANGLDLAARVIGELADQ